MAQKFTNNATTTLASAISAVDTTITVQSNDGEKFPDIDFGDPDEFAQCTLENATGEHEIVHVRGRSGDIFTVDRGDELTAPRAFSAGDRFELRLTARTMNSLVQREADEIDGGTF